LSNKKIKYGKCKFCEKESKFVDSHIIPLGLYFELRDDNGKVAQLVSPFKNEYQKRCQKGLYGRFLCDVHEKQFNKWDTYAIELLRDSEPTKQHDGWIYEEVNYKLLKLFFISLLWRAHATDNSFFDIDLGPHADKLKSHIAENNPGSPDQYAVLLRRSEEEYAKTVIAPTRQRVEGINFIRFYFPAYVAHIKVDERPLPQALKNYALKQSQSWFVPRKQYEGEIEEKMILQTAEKNLKRKKRQKDAEQ